MIRVSVQADDFDVGVELSALKAPHVGAQVSFTGLVRDDTGDLHHLEIEHYPAMTAKAIEAMALEAKARWALSQVVVIHRYGKIAPSEQIMMVATTSRHRKDAFAGAEFLMDYLKSRAPFWKKEVTQTGDAWVDAKHSDEAALTRWAQVQDRPKV